LPLKSIGPKKSPDWQRALSAAPATAGRGDATGAVGDQLAASAIVTVATATAIASVERAATTVVVECVDRVCRAVASSDVDCGARAVAIEGGSRAASASTVDRVHRRCAGVHRQTIASAILADKAARAVLNNAVAIDRQAPVGVRAAHATIVLLGGRAAAGRKCK
jgi:hypothetical protein